MNVQRLATALSPFDLAYGACALLCAGLALWSHDSVIALIVIIAFGLPHGALDGELARQILLPRFGRGWFPVFALPYLTLIACVLACWHIAPIWTLNLFLLFSLLHFGQELSDGSHPLLSAFVLGGAPLILPCVLQPARTAALLSGMIAPAQLSHPPEWLLWLSPIWGCAAVFLIALSPPFLRVKHFALIATTLIIFWVFEPLEAFMVYFIFIHAPAHIAALVHDSRWKRLVSLRTALKVALPLTIASLMIGMALWPLYTASPDQRLLEITFQLLAALTLPHMIFDLWLRWTSRAPHLGSGKPVTLIGI